MLSAWSSWPTDAGHLEWSRCSDTLVLVLATAVDSAGVKDGKLNGQLHIIASK